LSPVDSAAPCQPYCENPNLGFFYLGKKIDVSNELVDPLSFPFQLLREELFCGCIFKFTDSETVPGQINMDDYCQKNAEFPRLYTQICQQICDVVNNDEGSCSYWSYDESTFMCYFYSGYADQSSLYLSASKYNAGSACRPIASPSGRRLSRKKLSNPVELSNQVGRKSELILNFWTVSANLKTDHVMRTNLGTATEKFRKRFNSTCSLEYLETAPTEKVFEIRIATPFIESDHTSEDFKLRLCNAVGDAVDGLSGLKTYKCNRKIFILGTYRDPSTANIMSVFKITDNFGKVQSALRTRKGKIALRNKLKSFGLPSLSSAVVVPEEASGKISAGGAVAISLASMLTLVVAVVAFKKYKERTGISVTDKLYLYVAQEASRSQALATPRV